MKDAPGRWLSTDPALTWQAVRKLAAAKGMLFLSFP